MATKNAKDRKRCARQRRAADHRQNRRQESSLSVEIYDEPQRCHRSQRVQELHEHAVDLLMRGDGVGAERLLKEALELEPEACELRNNLCAAYEIQGRREEARALVREIYDRNPHYFVGRANLARICIDEGDVDRAAVLIGPLFKRRRVHVTEFAALSEAHLHLCLAKGEVKAAREWFEIWCEMTPGVPAQARWRRKLARTPLGWLRRRAMLRRRRR
jgi:predicted Zn-dependent protease